MDGFNNSKIETQTIYEIYRACRLCGAGAGYKMPIIQNVVDLDGAEVELKQKIRDCVQIEVHQDDKMPPLICELCVDKVNDFYEFLEMCRQTNKRTRLRLGLPPQTMPRGAPDAGDCILGITEPVFLNEDAREPLKTRTQMKNSKGSVKNAKSKHQDTKVKITLPTKKETRRKDRIEPRSLRSKQPSPPRLRGTKRSHDDDVSLGSLQRAKRTAMSLPKSILKKNEVDENTLLIPRSRSYKEKEMKRDTSKKVQIVVKSPPRVNKSQENSQYKCKICKIQYNNHRSYNNHMRIHANAKPADRKPSSSRRSSIECHHCKKTFISKQLLDIHRCSAKAVPVNCDTCGRKFSTNKAMSTHKSYCVQKKKATGISPALLRKVKPIQIRISRCDSLLESCVNGHYDVSNVPIDYGLDKHCIYPYISRVRIKSEPSYMVDINDEIKEAFDADKYIHWDSEDTASDLDVEDQDTVKKVDSLTSIALKSIFSPKLLGKVPKKRRKVKAEKAFDSILNASDFDSDIRLGIDSIIDRLDDTIDVSKDKSGDNDSLFGDDKAPIVTNDDFDALFGDTQNNDKTDDVNKVNDSKENNGERVGDKTIENDENAINKDGTVSSESENVSAVNPVNNDEDINEENDENARTKENTDSSEIENTVSAENSVNNGEDINNENGEIKESESSEKIEEINVNRTVECSESEQNNKNVESIENNESSKNNDENIVQSDDINEENSLDLDKLNETESKEMISENESIDKNNDNEQNNELDIIKEVVNNDQLNDTKVDEKLEENDQNYVNNKSDETLQSSDLKMEDDTEKDSTDNKNDGDNVKMTDIRDENDSEDVTMTESTNKNDAEDVTMTESTDINEANDVTNISESIDEKTQQMSPNKDNESSVKNDINYVNGETDVDEKFNMDDLEDVSDSEMDDKKLMDELDAQIGEDERKIIN